MKRKKQEKSVHRAAQRTEFIDEIQKVNNPLTKHTDPESRLKNCYMMEEKKRHP